ncbi:hypothetical protein GV819_27155 [Pseudomonas sp. Fl5BN2]|uniref:hypothetical protein n=1 Tax=unclassified Pseudomonas TaxID=196821 RepID=UPI001378D1E4|nr:MULTISPECIES: hypothetical protein [unclassified Pseudomonas]NBF05975.1 hypothetical protein [Pseudomonas sp. Fl5BN2]NBF10866.1 hypothetical protein [Pseudomonas sp. Fl4BN1]
MSNALTMAYYQGRDNHRGYVDDCLQALALDPQAIYRVKNSWSNCDRLAVPMDRRLAAWRAMGRPRNFE